jgi:hypothetical protein
VTRSLAEAAPFASPALFREAAAVAQPSIGRPLRQDRWVDVSPERARQVAIAESAG